MGVHTNTFLTVDCDNCHDIMADEELWEGYGEPDGSDLRQIANDYYGAYDQEVNGDYFEMLCENCYNDIIGPCSICDEGEQNWVDNHSYWCEDEIMDEEHPDCIEEHHQNMFARYDDHFGDDYDCSYCGYELAEHPSPLSDGYRPPILQLNGSS